MSVLHRRADYRDLLPPNVPRVRRWFKSNLGMTFHDYCRSLRIGQALSAISNGVTATGAAFDSGYESLSGFAEAVQRVAGSSPSIAAEVAPVLMSRISTPLGTMVAGARDGSVVFLEFADRRGFDGQVGRLAKRTGASVVTGRTRIHDALASQLDGYFSGTREVFDVPVDLCGTAFQITVWRALMEIQYGETRSYGEQAAQLGRPNAVRAVATANGANRIAILVPCHRVVGADGSLTGYGGGLWRKQRLLELERGQIAFQPAQVAVR